MKTYLEKLPGLLAFIESGNGIAKKKARKELEEMAKEADLYAAFKALGKKIYGLK